MANFFLCLDPDEDRRRRTMAAASARLAFLPSLVSGAANCAELSVAWAAGPRAPVSQAEAPVFGMCFGAPIPAEGAEPLDSAGILANWLQPDHTKGLCSHDGYYAGFAYRPGERLVVGADRLGYFPIYYYQRDEVALVASSPEGFDCHPAFHTRFEPHGLVGLLLTNGLVAGKTLLQEVHRLDAGSFLIWDRHRGLRELPGEALSLGDDYRDLSFTDQLDLLDAGFRSAIARHAPSGRPYSLLLSGGLDSRTVGGYLQTANREVTAVTLGWASDYEVQCARSVARALGAPQTIGEIDLERYVEYFGTHVAWDHCASGSSLLMDWGIAPILESAAAHSATGLGLDWVLGGHAPVVADLSFAKFFEYQNTWGLAPHRLEALLRSDRFDGLVPETGASLERSYRSVSDIEWQRCWAFSLRHRNRFHIGSEAWRFCFASWPVLPAADATLLKLGGHLPPAAMADRRAQVELLKRRFPSLAALPLDRNSPDTSPVNPTAWWQLTNPVRRPLQRIERAVRSRLGRSKERRRYYRVFDIGGPGWLAVRRSVEPLRPLGYEFFERSALDAMWPPPEAQVHVRDGITDVAALKTIWGFLAWAQRHL
jgi:asparagine synthase (glutamine-hydrolysing)